MNIFWANYECPENLYHFCDFDLSKYKLLYIGVTQKRRFEVLNLKNTRRTFYFVKPQTY